MERTIKWTAVDRKAGMTLGELRAMLTEAGRLGLSDSARVTASTGYREQVRWLSMEGSVIEPPSIANGGADAPRPVKAW